MAEFIREGRLFRVTRYDPSHRQLQLRSDATEVDRTSTRVEVCFWHVELMLLRPIYAKGLHIRRASADEFAELARRHDLTEDAARFTWMLERHGDGFVVGGPPSWREAEFPFTDGRSSLFDFSRPWPPEFPAQWGSLG
ncbi:hypothetical protein [Peterkaempfera griseoplana]|uniref:hypothetical protein n=1 Tax=Peterkaempfera griseoplana TaxID=66896 RepID=UPI0006E2F1F2|nr:hypothetical protein [Peterkaempfera griseoplana]